MRIFPTGCGALLLTGCVSAGGPPPAPPAYLSGLALSAGQSATTAGGVIPLTLTNNSAQPIGYDLCRGALERNVDGFWVPAPAEYKACSQGFVTLQPGDSASANTPIGSALDSDEYRYVTEVTDLNGVPAPDLLRSNAFRVEAAAD